MILIIGLGNPGPEYKNTFHNIGFRAAEILKLKIESFSDWKNSEKLLAEISQGKIAGEKAVLAKPQTFMNNSGRAAGNLVRYYFPGRPADRRLLVIHDDIDLPLGKIRIAENRGSAGHKGVESIIKELKTKNFIRLRIGIQPKSGKPENPEKFVLRKFSKEEKEKIEKAVGKTTAATEILFGRGLEEAMNEFNE
jgi:peptidyl-tRNA hydrolase, PTH1 family